MTEGFAVVVAAVLGVVDTTVVECGVVAVDIGIVACLGVVDDSVVV